MEEKNIDLGDVHNLYGHNDLEGFSKYIGIDYEEFLEINNKNIQAISQQIDGKESE